MPAPWTGDPWMILKRSDLDFERRQAAEEGRDLEGLDGELDALIEDHRDDDLGCQPGAMELLERIQEAPLRDDYPYTEPSHLAGIRKARPEEGPAVAPPSLSKAERRDRLYGAWLGRCGGCLAGKPVEGRRRASMERILKAQGRWPLDHYWAAEVDAEVAEAENWYKAESPAVLPNIDSMPEDDDTNYTAAGLAILESRGADFEPADVARFWLRRIPFFHVCTAERAAYRNLVMMIGPPDRQGRVDGDFSSATWCNPYREWIGAQIRADFYGWAAPGDPERAAEWAWRDAAVSHVANGLYGAMWVAAMLAAAWTTDDPERIVRAGLAQVPEKSRLAEAIHRVLAWKADGWTFERALDRVHTRWNEADRHDWCHTIPNAAIVAVGLLWGDMDFETSVARAVTCAFDTDCNGATVGSIVGLARGAEALPEKWTAPIQDTLHTGIHGMTTVKLSLLARRSLTVIDGL